MNLPDLSPSMLWAFTAMAFVYGTGMTLTVAIFALVYLSTSG